jgi:glycosyltransferase involved in cell wall biosynthesis
MPSDEPEGIMAISYGFLSTHPPTECGLATFNSALARHLGVGEAGGGIVRVVAEREDSPLDPHVTHTWPADDVEGWRLAAKALNTFDVAIVQHEYGIYPGADGGDVVPLLRQLAVPSIVVLHTVLATPTPRQKSVLEQVARAAHAVVTMTATARDRLLAGYQVDREKVTVIPHGAGDHARAPVDVRPRPHLLTWGLLGPGKGIEWALRAVARLRDLRPSPTYTVAGKTHPRVLERHGEQYRSGLQLLTDRLGLAGSVHFDPIYRDDESLSRLIRSADVVVLPYDSREQVTSGVLTEAVAAGVPVVATPFPHAVDLLTDGPGLLVPYADAAAMAGAIREILTKPDLAASLTSVVSSSTPLWSAVAARYTVLAEQLLAAHPAAAAA